MRTKICWKWVRIPKEIHDEIKNQAQREKTAIWKILTRAWSYWRTTNRNHHVKHSDLDKIAWYIYKLSSSVGELRGFPKPGNLKQLEKTCQQIQKRLGVNTGKILLAAYQYLRDPSSKNRMVLNDSAKSVIFDILSSITP